MSLGPCRRRTWTSRNREAERLGDYWPKYGTSNPALERHVSRRRGNSAAAASGLESGARGGAMAHPNEHLVREGYQAFIKADMQKVSGFFADDIVWHVGGRGPLAGDYRG